MKTAIRLFVLFALIIIFSGKLFANGDSNSPDEPRIKFNREFVDLGKVKEGVILFRTFEVKNVGNAPLRILDTKSTCGCTVPEIKKSVLKPHETTVLRVKIDTSMKQNKVTKTLDVLSSDPDRPVVTLSMAMDVENRHKNLSSKNKYKILSDEKCMGCHVYKGVGAFGRDLYEADCAMCHGPKAQGESGPNLLTGGYDNETLIQSRRKIIACGSTGNNAMPGFEYTCGGPLSKEQIDSLIDYLKALSKNSDLSKN